jgi:hypothetical protein
MSPLMVNRFQFYDEVASYKERSTFSQYTVIGLHVRAGNKERGDFKRKKRNIPNIEKWMVNVGKLLATIMAQSDDPRFTTSASSYR